MFKRIANKTKIFFNKTYESFKKAINLFYLGLKRVMRFTRKIVLFSLYWIYRLFIKYGIFIILLVPMILAQIQINDQSIISRIGDNYLVDIIVIIANLLPMIFTILVVALSLPSEKICGITAIEFRNLRGWKTFSFLQMVIVTILIFVIYSIFTIFNQIVYIWALNIIAVFYSIRFICQEVPILTKREKTILKIAKKSWYERLRDPDALYKKEYKNLNIVIQNLILDKGIVKIYKDFQGKNIKNDLLLDSLLEINNEYFFDLIDQIDLIFNSSKNNEYNGTSIVNAVDMSFSNLRYLTTFNDDFNIVKIYGDSKHYYHLTRLLFKLHTIMNTYKAKEKFDKSLNQLLDHIFLSIDYGNLSEENLEFLYSFLNAIVKITVSNNEIWFLQAIRDANYNSRFLSGNNDEYFYFISMYLYYLNHYDLRVPDTLKKDINEFIKEEADGINADGSNWLSVFQHKLNFTNYNHIVQILPKLLKIRKDDISPWYEPKHCTFWASEDGWFSKELIIRCWLELLIFNYYNSQFNDDIFDEVIGKLDKAEKNILAVELNNHWIRNNDLNIRPKKETSFLSFYTLKQDIHPYNENNLIKKLKNIATSVIYDELKDEFDEHQKQDEDLAKIKQKFINGFNNTITNFSIIDKNIKLDKEKFVCYDLLCDTRWSDELVDNYVKKFDYSFKNLIYENIKADSNINKESINNSNKEKVFTKLLKYNYMSGDGYGLYKYFSDEKLLEFNKIKESDLFLPQVTFYNEGAIKINLKCDEEKTFVRKLNSNEINTIIDRDYKVFNGLYKYCESSDDSRSIFITRDKIYDLIKKKYFYSRIVFRYKIVYDYDNIYIVDCET